MYIYLHIHECINDFMNHRLKHVQFKPEEQQKFPKLWSCSLWPRLWLCPAVCCWNSAFLLFFIRMSHTPPTLPNPTSLPPPIRTTPQHHHHHHHYSSDTVLELLQIKKHLSMRKCRMTLHRDITVGVGVFFNCLPIPSPTSPPLLPWEYPIHQCLPPF